MTVLIDGQTLTIEKTEDIEYAAVDVIGLEDEGKLIASDEVLSASWSRRFATRLHLLMCRHCRNYANQIRAIGSASRQVAQSTAPDSEQLSSLEQSIARALENRKSSKPLD